ncbi:MAG: penicillin-binding protein [Anaerolineae bacterium]
MNNGVLVSLIRQRRRRNQNGNSGHIALRLLALAVVVVVLSGVLLIAVGVGTAVGVYAYFTKDLPAPEEVGRQTQWAFKTTKIYDRTGNTLLYEIFDPQGGNRTLVPLEQIPQHLINATIAIEDKNFYENPGFDIEGIARAAWNNLRGLPIQGASSITMQLIRNVIIPPEERMQRTFQRKFKELVLSWELSRRYPGRQGKDQILEWYLNTIYYGNLAYGVEAAAEAYFGKHVWDLSLAESAMLAAIPQWPAINPLSPDPDIRAQAKKRQEIVLDQMYLQGYISAEEAYVAKQEKLRYASKRFDIIAPHFVMYVRQLLEEKYGPELLYRGGLKVYTTLDLDLQRAAREIARQHIAKLQEENRNVSNAAVVVIDPRTAEILTMLGSIDYFDPDIDGQVNVALAPRQPGSAFKPFTYVTAFAKGYTPATLIMDVRTSFPDDPNPPYAPENYDRRYHGPQLLRSALANSYNIPAVKLLDMVGVQDVINTAHHMGINTLTREYYGLSLTLGGGEVTLLDMTYAFSVFANGGIMRGQPVPPEKRRPGFRELDPVAILRIEDAEGNVLERYDHPESRVIFDDPRLPYLITNILSDNAARSPAFGANSMLKLSRPAAVKTGTTTDWRDAWTVGYTPQLVTGVWVGNSDNQPMERTPGSRGAAPIWHDFMELALAPLPVEDFVRPPGFEEVEICATSGLLPTEHCPNRRKELFIAGTAPTAYCNMHQVFRICKPSGKLATVYCPPDQVEEKVFEIYPAEAADWVRANNIPQPPTEYDDTFGPTPASGDVAILNPKPYAYVHGQVPIEGNAKGDGFQLYRLQYGEGLDPSAWIQIGADHHNAVDRGLLEVWDTSQLEGLYTLQLTVVRHDGGVQTEAIQVTVDNVPPEVELVYPWPDKVYVMEDDEWVSMQAEATDNVSMDRVEFYLDDRLLTHSTVPPYNVKWTIVMSDITPADVPAIVESQGITEEVSMAMTGVGYTIQFPNGFGVIRDSEGYTETHQIHAIAYDAAGNQVESEKVRIFVVHEKEEEKQETSFLVRRVWPIRRREQRGSLLG